MERRTEFEIQVASYIEGYEDLVAEISYRGEHCILISQEQGLDMCRVAIAPRSDGQPWEFSLNDLCAAIAKAKESLWELRRC